MFHVEQKTKSIMDLKSKIREIPDFPTKGISFKDITTLLKDKQAFRFVTDEIVTEFKDKHISKVLGIESRGFIFGGALALELDAGFVPVRKKGKLPAEVISEIYELEYGTDTIEMHSDAISKEDVVLIHDDLLATGGTANAVYNILKRIGVKNIYFSFVCDLEFILTPQKEVIQKFNPHILVKY
ncbi:adenine phosphoribosyltransferase [Tangfeifania diversioriginum]|uniref:Adenine phosphoribosyltransferase n=2 Tax=Tangfeifania diversioriginum TaxID=1168035 RepID=A0A1M6FBW0_9BACT|nr:adenine phosphoribosyltransferase [Tangfeifania diversioriginum]